MRILLIRNENSYIDLGCKCVGIALKCEWNLIETIFPLYHEIRIIQI